MRGLYDRGMMPATSGESIREVLRFLPARPLMGVPQQAHAKRNRKRPSSTSGDTDSAVRRRKPTTQQIVQSLTSLSWAPPILSGEPRPEAGLFHHGAQSGPVERPVGVPPLWGHVALRATPPGSVIVGCIRWRREE